MGAYGLENDKFYSFGRTQTTRNTFADKSNDFLNAIGKKKGSPAAIAAFGVGAVSIGAVIARGRKKRADKARQAIQDKYETLDVGCGGIENSMRVVNSDLSMLKSSKPKKKKDQRDWEAQVSETEEVARELATKKRALICVTESGSSVGGPVVVKDEIPTTPDKQNAFPSSNPMQSTTPSLMNVPKLGALYAPATSDSGQTSEGATPAKKKTWLYALLGLAVVGGIVYFVRRK